MSENARNIPSPVRVWMRFYAQFNTASTSIFHILGAFSSFISRRFNAAVYTLRYDFSCFTRVEFVIYFNQSIAFIIPLLTTFLQLKYQGNDENKSPFATHPTTMLVAISSSIVSYLAFIALFRFPLRHFAVVAYHCLVWSGYVSVASLASILFPDSFTPFIYAVFVLLPATEFLYWLYHNIFGEEDGVLFRGHRRGGRRFLNNLWRAMVNSSGQRPQVLPI